MQVAEELNEGLKRAYKITVLQDEIETAKTARLQEIAKTAKIQGFRPGKAPMNIIRQRYGKEVEAEVLDQVVNEGAQKALNDNNLRPAVRPKVDVTVAEDGKGIEFKMEVEILPIVEPIDFSTLKFEKQVADVDDNKVDEAVKRIAKSMRKPEPAAHECVAKKGDVAVIDFDGSVDGEKQDGMKAEGYEVELGSQSLIDTFEDQIVGMKIDEKKDITVTFPSDYHATDLAGKEAVFAVELKDILVHKDVELNDELAKEIGFPSLEKLRDRIRRDIAGNYEQISRVVLKRELMDELAEKHHFDLPETLVEQEFSGIWAQIERDRAEGRLSKEEAEKDEAALKADYHSIAVRRIRLGLLLAHVAESNKIKVERNELNNAMMAEARRFSGQEQAVLEYLMKTEGAIERLRAPILEEKVVDFILGKADVTEKKISVDELMKLPEEME